MALAKHNDTPAQINRRDLLTAALAAPLTAVPAVAVAAKVMTRDEQIAHHKAELFRLFSTQVPDGTELTGVTIMLERNGLDFNVLSARDEQAFYICGHDGGWSKTLRKDKARTLVGEA
ncbi:hypothetical protein [Paenirhodobacter populi]|uniref:Uncharacterized protein n=1 Tax=Paenirhodobacter populi TaxID=2306993 RepID=A0A443IPK2_9RHOB|nr:hypothetical protein [Sinirhodobacter populi]RWR08519.1 hypothetical protein D2T33_15600 [Sinirhodobacter populi]